jgi:hypothetical protein
MLGVIPRLKIDLRFFLELYTPSRLMTLPARFNPKMLEIDTKLARPGFNNMLSFLLPGALTKGERILQFLSQKATTLSPL